MSLIRDDDEPALRLGILAVVLLALGLMMKCGHVHAEQHTVTLRGRLVATADEAGAGVFVLDGDAGRVKLDVSQWDYLTDYLAGGVGKSLRVELTPE